MMVRPATAASLGLCLALGFGLFQIKYEVQNQEEELVKIHRQTTLDQEQMHVLAAEWSYLTQPVRLGLLASRHLNLQPVTSAQLGTFDSLPLKGDDPSAGDNDVPIAEVLKAMQMASAGPVPAARPAVKPSVAAMHAPAAGESAPGDAPGDDAAKEAAARQLAAQDLE